jgi:NAD-dependent DNA ligase
MNQDLIEIGETPYSNPRNTSGSLKLQDSAGFLNDRWIAVFIMGTNCLFNHSLKHTISSGMGF